MGGQVGASLKMEGEYVSSVIRGKIKFIQSFVYSFIIVVQYTYYIIYHFNHFMAYNSVALRQLQCCTIIATI